MTVPLKAYAICQFATAKAAIAGPLPTKANDGSSQHRRRRRFRSFRMMMMSKLPSSFLCYILIELIKTSSTEQLDQNQQLLVNNINVNRANNNLSLVGTIDSDGDGAAMTQFEESNQNTNQDNVRKLLVRQLTDLIMNHEPETIAQTVDGRTLKIKGDMAVIRDAKLGADHQFLPVEAYNRQHEAKIKRASEDDNYSAPSSSSASSFTSSDSDSGGGDKIRLDMMDQETQDFAATTDILSPTGARECDYDDPIDTPISLIDQSGMPTGNLTLEQQQQLLAGSADLINSSMTNYVRHTPCIQPSYKMIEIITKYVAPTLFTIIIVVGLVGNIVVMLVILEDRKTDRELTPTGLLILDLSLADLSFIIFCIPFTAWDYSVGHWVFGSLWCKFNQYLIVVCALSSIYTLVLMSIDRFMAIVYPIKCMSYRTSKNTLHAIYIKWLIILIMASPTIPRHGLIDLNGEQLYTCRFLADQYDALQFQIIFFISSYLFPLILIFCLYLSLLNKLWFGTKPHGHKESLKTLESKKKVTWLVAGIVVVFALCWCPIQIMLILMRLKSHKITATYIAIQVFSHTLGYMNSCVNPIVYAFASETFVNSFKRSALGRSFYRCMCMKINANHDNNDTRTHLNHSNIAQRSNNYNVHSQINHHSIVMPHNGCNNNDSLATTALLSETNQQQQASNRIISLPLEPRDRIIPATPPPASSTKSTNSNQVIQMYGGCCESDPVSLQNRETSSKVTNLGPTTTTTAANSSKTSNSCERAQPNQPAKQLIARVIQSGNQVSHRCEPCYQRELVTP